MNTQTQTRISKISDLVFDFDTYLHKDSNALKKIMKFIVSGTPCPPIDVDANMRIIGGHEQWVAAVNTGKEFVSITVHDQIRSNTDALMFACNRYANKLTQDERNTAVYLVLSTTNNKKQRTAIKRNLCDILDMSQREVNQASLRRENTRSKHYDEIVDLFLGNHTVREIAHTLNLPPKQVKQTLSAAGLYVVQNKPVKNTPVPDQLCLDDIIGENLDKAISIDQIDIDSLIDEIEGTKASLNEEYQRYGITLNNYETNRKSVQRSVNKMCRSMQALMEQLQSTIPVLRDPQLVQALTNDIQPLNKTMREFMEIVDNYTDYAGSNKSVSPIKQQFMNVLNRAC